MKTREGVTPWPPELAAEYRRLGYWRGLTVTDPIYQLAKTRGGRPAVADGDLIIDYAGLIDRVEACAGRLLGLGIRSDDRIVLQLPNGWQFVVLTLACLRVGIIPVMALPAHREHELRYIVDHSEAVAIAAPGELRGFDHAALATRLRDTTDSLQHVILQNSAADAGGDTLDLDALCAPKDPHALPIVLPSPEASSVAVFLLSGGTTGLPKLIARTHDDYVCNVYETTRHAGFDGDVVYLGSLPLGHNFPFACPGWLGALYAGGTVVPLSSPQPSRAFEAIERHGATHTAVVPAVAASWLEYATQSGAAGIRTLRVLQVGGARLADELAAKVEPVLGARLQQVFGMAEGLINVTRLDDAPAIIAGTQGRPVCADDEIQIIDEVTGANVSPGKTGGLLTRGPYTPRGYYAAPEANARSFTPDGWYITGDIVRMTAEGNLVVEGRSKDMINRGGENISAEEIENLVYRMERVHLAAAVAMKHDRLGETICLFVVHDDELVLELTDVHDAFDGWGVAAFKKPERLVRLPELPLTKVGKIDKAALRGWLEINPIA